MHRHKILNHLVQHNKQHHRNVLLGSFHLNGQTLGFHSQTTTFKATIVQQNSKQYRHGSKEVKILRIKLLLFDAKMYTAK